MSTHNMLTSDHNDHGSARLFTEAEARRIIDETVSYLDPQGRIVVQISSWWGASQRWARNRAALTADQREVTLSVVRRDSIGRGIASATNQTDSASLKGITEHTDFYARRWDNERPPDQKNDRPPSDVKGAIVWSDETFNRTIVDNAVAVEELTRLAEAEQLMSAGYIETTGCTSLLYTRDAWGDGRYEWGRVTQAQCSVTVRHAKGSGSGWAGKTSFDIHRVNIPEIARLALEKCKQSLNPVRIEPGRYQTILEPQATATMTEILIGSFERHPPESSGWGPFFLGVDQSINRMRSKLGLRVIDERLSIFHDPTNAHAGTHVAPFRGRVDFVENGILTGLVDLYRKHLNEISDAHPYLRTTSYTMRGGVTPIEEMIATTKRGLLVSRLAQAEVVDGASLLFTGVTRDGLWLIENGKITKSVRNFRWTESPLFILNNVEQVGVEEQVFDPVTRRDPLGSYGNSPFSWSLNNVVVPPIKVNDFSFTSTIDAV